MKVMEFNVQRPTAANLLRESEVGPIPQDWKVIKLAARATIQSGIAKNANATLRDPLSVPYLRVANVQDGYLDLGEVSMIDIERTDSKRYAVLPGDVLMNEGGDLDKLGRGALWRGQISPCVHQNHVFVVRCKDGLVPEYLNAWTSSAQARRYFMLAGRQTTNLASINMTSLGELPIAVPPTENEQHQIAEALIDTDALIDSLEQLLTKKRQIKQGAMQELLTGRRRLPGFSGDWSTAKVADLERIGVLELSRGKVISKKSIASDPGQYPIYSSSVHNNGLFGCYGSFMFDEELITWSVDGGGDFFYRPRHKFSVTNVCGYMRVRREVNCQFLAMQLQQQHSTKSFDYQTKAHPSVVRAEYLVHLPELREQVAVAEALSDIGEELATLESRLTKARALKQAMAQALLTGCIRLVEPAA